MPEGGEKQGKAGNGRERREGGICVGWVARFPPGEEKSGILPITPFPPFPLFPPAPLFP